MSIDRRQFVKTGIGLAGSLALSNSRMAFAQSVPSFEFAIVGAGLFGSAAARHLSGLSDSVVLIGPEEPESRREHDGVFASHYDVSRLVRGIDPDLLWATLAKRSIQRYRAIENMSGQSFYRDIGYMMVTPGGLGEDWFNLPAMREVAGDLGVAIEDLDDASLRQRFPYLEFTPGSNAVLQPANAGYIDPRKLVTAQQKIAVQQGTTLHRDIVARLDEHNGQVEMITGNGDRMRANRVLVATGAYTNATGLLNRELELLIRAAMIMETEVSANANFEYPTTLYAKTDGEEDYWGLLMPPVKYADGRTIV